LNLKRALNIEGVAFFAVLITSLAAPASAQTRIGDRVFLHTIFLGTPGVGDDLTVPSFSWSKEANGTPSTTYSASLSKRITENIGVVISEPTWTRTGPIEGFQNLVTAVKYMPVTSVEHEMMMCIGLQVEWGDTGTKSFGVNSFSTITPQLYIGKGFGDLPESLSFLRPLAFTGQFGVALPAKPNTSGDPLVVTGGATIFNWNMSLQYSSEQLSISGARISPLVEASFNTPVANPLPGQDITTGTISSGVAVSFPGGVQLTTEAVFPINSLSGRGVGVVASLTFTFGELFPQTLGKPLFQSHSQLQRNQ